MWRIFLRLSTSWLWRGSQSENNFDGISTESYKIISSRDHPENLLKNCSLVKELDDSAQGTGFAFIVMADVFTKIPGAPFW